MTVRTQHAEAGFTLVETLVAMFVFALLAAAGSGVMMQTLAGKTRLEDESAQLGQLAAMHAALKDDLGQAVLRPARAAGGNAVMFTGGLDDPDPAVLALVRRGWVNPGAMERRSSLLAVSYRIEDGALIRTAWLRPDATEDTPVRERVLIDGVQSAQIRFLSRGVWSEFWAAGSRGALLPDAVELVLEIEGAGPVRQMFLTGRGVV